MCMFGNVNIDCDICPKSIKEICNQNFSESLQDIIALAVDKTRYGTLHEIYFYLCSIGDEEIERHYLRKNNCHDSIIDFRKDILEEIEIKIDDEILLNRDLENKIKAKESQRQMFTQEPKIDIPLAKSGTGRLCNTCNKADVCKYKDDTLSEVEKLFNVTESINAFLDVQVSCKKWSGTVNNVR